MEPYITYRLTLTELSSHSATFTLTPDSTVIHMPKEDWINLGRPTFIETNIAKWDGKF